MRERDEKFHKDLGSSPRGERHPTKITIRKGAVFCAPMFSRSITDTTMKQASECASSRQGILPFPDDLPSCRGDGKKNINREKMVNGNKNSGGDAGRETAEETADSECDVKLLRSGDFREAAVGRKSVYEPLLRRSGLFVFVNIASSRSLSRSRREQHAAEMSNYRRGALPLVYQSVRIVRLILTLFSVRLARIRLARQRNASVFNDGNAI